MIPLLSSDLLLAFVCAMMKIISEDAQKRHTKVKRREGRILTKIICFVNTIIVFLFSLSRDLIFS